MKKSRSSRAARAAATHLKTGFGRLKDVGKNRQHRTLRLSKGQKVLGGYPLPPVIRLIRESFSMLWIYRRLMFGLALIYAIAAYAIVGGISQLDFVAIKDATFDAVGDSWNTTGSLFVAAITGGLHQSSGELQQFLSGLVTFLFWLAAIRALRRLREGKPTGLRDSLYAGAAPLIPSSIILCILFLQLVPGALGAFLFTVMQSGVWLQGTAEMILIGTGAGLLCLLSLYMVIDAALAMMLVTQPKAYPLRSLLQANALIIGQRTKVVVRVVTLFAVVLVGWAIVLFPVLLLDRWLWVDWLPLVPVVAQLLGAVTLVFSAVYIHNLYWSLSHEQA